MKVDSKGCSEAMNPQERSIQECKAQLRQTLVNLLGPGSEAIAQEELALMDPYSACVAFDAQQHLLQAGALADRIFYLCQGLVRFYYLTEDGREHNKSFVGTGQFAGAVQTSQAL